MSPRRHNWTIASHLNARDLLSLERVSRECRLLASEEAHWKQLCLQKFNVPRHREPESWKALYRFNHQLFISLFASTDSGDGSRIGRLSGPVVIPAPPHLFV